MSARISGVKNFESKAVSLLRGLPFNQVQSQSEKGAIFSFLAGAAVESADDSERGWASVGLDNAGLADVVAGKNGAVLAKAAGAEDDCAAVRLLSSASSSSMRAFMAANSLAMSAVDGSGTVAECVVGTSGATVGSCKAATLAGASGWFCALACGARQRAKVKTSTKERSSALDDVVLAIFKLNPLLSEDRRLLQK